MLIRQKTNAQQGQDCCGKGNNGAVNCAGKRYTGADSIDCS
jgi:hypothetical protein